MVLWGFLNIFIWKYLKIIFKNFNLKLKVACKDILDDPVLFQVYKSISKWFNGGSLHIFAGKNIKIIFKI